MIDKAERHVEHAYGDPVRTDVYQVRTIEVWGDWHQTVETWKYTCECGHSVEIRREVNGPPPRPDRCR